MLSVLRGLWPSIVYLCCSKICLLLLTHLLFQSSGAQAQLPTAKLISAMVAINKATIRGVLRHAILSTRETPFGAALICDSVG